MNEKGTAAAADASFRVNPTAAPLRHSVVEGLRDAIAIGRFQPGQRLVERELCDIMGVSRTLIREALRQLESEGVITIRPNRGPIVTRLTAEQARGIYAVRSELEGLAAQLFAEKATKEHRKALVNAFSQLKKLLRSGSQIERLHAKNEFYNRLIEGAQNEALGDTLRMLNSRVTILRATSLQAKGRHKESLNELQALLDALFRGDPEAARKASAAHVEGAASAALAQLSDASK
ncbi:GntR family transcriptional regulator [Halomonas sp. TRM85114]|uniref:GntR family transcriptional regulator n=1 Tax=Halomonas jincaotanensis TaxID=2810616 RepID=UPI001BD42349|nr:GntR family transcriptional regulator [Halomonas jincaotanensis]MBS9403668.1 GntR family transcriptional regulator [Halomonas jincaotanensis]